MSPVKTPIQRKLMTIILLTAAVAVGLTCASFLVYEFLTFKKTAMRQLTVQGEIIAANSTGSLAFENQSDAQEVLAALKAERHIVAACLYDKNGRLFSKYPADRPVDAFPAAPKRDGYRFEHSHLAGFQPVVQGANSRLGTLYLVSDMGAMYEMLRLYGVIVMLVMAVSLLVAYTISKVLQKQISQPILALAETARAISDRQDYSVRATKLGEDELGLLTDAFNQMLARIHDQNEDLQQNEARERAVLEASRMKNEFLSRMSHELRTPLNAILGFGQLLEMGSLTEEDRQSVDYILKGGRHLLKLIDEVLDIARIESGRLNVSVEPVCLADILADSILLVRPIMSRRITSASNRC
jgi:signal transduction histidine kinase